MESQEIIFFVLTAVGIWLIALSFFVYRIYNHFKILSKDVTGQNLIAILERVIEKQKKNGLNIDKLASALTSFQEESKNHIQKFNLVRFNPFKELGGDHSFALTLLDANDNGAIITGLHTRERTRVYIKSVKKGKVDVELSLEEKKSLHQAQKG